MSCMVPDCDDSALNYLGIRLRKPDTNAVFAPDLDAFLCKEHAEAGGAFDITFVPGTSGTVEATVFCGGHQICNRETPIQQSAA